MITSTDAALWYNVGVFGAAGYAVPNWSDDIGTLNPSIYDLTMLLGRNFFAIMHNEDVWLDTPPSINTLRRVHQLYVRAGQILSGRAIPPGTNQLESMHGSPSGHVFRVFPVPYFKVRNPHMARWAQWMMLCLTECFQHVENRKTIEITTTFAGDVGKFLTRIYENMAIELFGKTREQATAPGFLLTAEELSAYDPSKFFTRVEMIGAVPRLDLVFTEDQVRHLAEGLPVTQLPPLGPWPENLQEAYRLIRNDQVILPDGTDSSVTGGVAPDGAAVAKSIIPPPVGP